MSSLKVPVSIKVKIAEEIADPLKIYQHELSDQKLKPKAWNDQDQCLFNCGHGNKISRIHTGTGAFSTKCCSEKGANVFDFFLKKHNGSKEKAVKSISKIMGISVSKLPDTIRGSLSLKYSQSVSTPDGELVQLLGIYGSGVTLLFETDEDFSDEGCLMVQRVRYETSAVLSESEYYEYCHESFYLSQLFENASANGLVKSGAVINVNGNLFIDESRFDGWFSTVAKRGKYV